jgi:hypothetical protein
MNPLQRGHRSILLIRFQIGVTASLEFSLETATAVIIDIPFLFDPQMQPSIHDFAQKQFAFQQSFRVTLPSMSLKLERLRELVHGSL